EVKRRSADGSVGSPHARVGHCQASNKVQSLMRKHGAFYFVCYKYLLLFRSIFTPVFNTHHKNHAIFFARYLF
ncbi:hypothetical protein ACGS9J_14020, partial [Serratia quinivorans]|uniref:hypothetical protein n=1 Tax=Serratia quinivorans TaxID=137545 RepID=UPI003F9750F6